tara:strand:- start:300 stop:1961 length:1662 start_codon:yes stop_codon:yes gene_type:complete
MATANKNIGQYRGSNMGAYRNPKMIVEDPLIGLKSFQQSYNSMFAQMQLQKANEQKEKDEFEKAMSPFADKIYDSQENLKYYSDINRNSLQNSADGAVQLLKSGDINKREGQELVRNFIDDQRVFNKLSDKLMVNRVALDQLDMSQPETQEFIKIANAFNSKNATIFQNLNKNGGRYEVNGGVKIGDKVYTTTDIGRILGSIEQSQVINENNNTTLNTAIKAISEKSITDIKNLANEGRYGTRDEVISRNIDELDVFMDTSESDDGLDWIFSNKVKDQNKNNITDQEITTALSGIDKFDYDRAGTYGALLRKNPSILNFGDEELKSLAMRISASDNIDDNDAEVLEELSLIKNEIKKNKVKDWYKTNLTKVVDSKKPTVDSISTDRRLTQMDKNVQVSNLVSDYYEEQFTDLFERANALGFDNMGPKEEQESEDRQKLDQDIKNAFINARTPEGRIHDVIISNKNPETGEETDKTFMYIQHDTGDLRGGGEVKKILSEYKAIDYSASGVRAALITDIVSTTYKGIALYNFANMLELGGPVKHNVTKSNKPLNK